MVELTLVLNTPSRSELFLLDLVDCVFLLIMWWLNQHDCRSGQMYNIMMIKEMHTNVLPFMLSCPFVIITRSKYLMWYYNIYIRSEIT